MELSRQEYWSGLPFPSSGDLPDPGFEPVSPALAGRFFTTELRRKPYTELKGIKMMYKITQQPLEESCSQSNDFSILPHGCRKLVFDLKYISLNKGNQCSDTWWVFKWLLLLWCAVFWDYE